MIAILNTGKSRLTKVEPTGQQRTRVQTQQWKAAVPEATWRADGTPPGSESGHAMLNALQKYCGSYILQV
ncbi:MAG: hypothetical protein GY862_37995 [Gammaproteobacteria bacterium]|nr:hypothetical protein [Gammaproteobacteria bacterium]